MFQYIESIMTTKDEYQIIELVGASIPNIELNESLPRHKIGLDFERKKKKARKMSKYYLYQKNGRYVIETNKSRVDIYTPRIFMDINIDEGCTNIELNAKYKFLENGIALCVFMAGMLLAGDTITSISSLLFFVFILILIFSPGMILFKRMSKKMTKAIRAAII